MSAERFTVTNTNASEALQSAKASKDAEAKSYVETNLEHVRTREGFKGRVAGASSAVENLGTTSARVDTKVEFLGADMVSIGGHEMTREVAINAGLLGHDGKALSEEGERLPREKQEGPSDADKDDKVTEKSKLFSEHDAALDALEELDPAAAAQITREAIEEDNYENVPEVSIKAYTAHAEDVLKDQGITSLGADGPLANFLEDSDRRAALRGVVSNDPQTVKAMASRAMDNATRYLFSTEGRQVAAEQGVQIQGDRCQIDDWSGSLYEAVASGRLTFEFYDE